jgi:broad specificity phosphatase PhoE
MAIGQLQMLMMIPIFGNDKKWSKKSIPEPNLIADLPKEEKILIFIRHGESDWNLIFNKGLFKMPFRLVRAFFRELTMLATNDSSFYDSPLNEEGMEQAEQLMHHVDASKDSKEVDQTKACMLSYLRGEGSSVIVCSNLRRAIATAVIGLSSRWKETNEKIYISSQLQEISTNVDTLALAEAGALPDVERYKHHFDGKDDVVRQTFNVDYNTGNKKLCGKGANGLARMQSFCKWAMEREEDAIIVGGHSMYFRYFFRSFLPTNATTGLAAIARAQNDLGRESVPH